MRAEEEEVRTALGLEMRVWIVETVSTYLALCGEQTTCLLVALLTRAYSGIFLNGGCIIAVA